jgi:predicted HicB family RNase H-like nuclease
MRYMSNEEKRDASFLTTAIEFSSITVDLARGKMRKSLTLNLRVSPEFKRKLVGEAKKEKRSVTNYIEVALAEWWRRKHASAKKQSRK